MTTSRSLLVISASLDEAGRGAVATGEWPRKDFFELEGNLGADVLDYEAVTRSCGWRIARRLVGMPAAQALIAWSRSRRYDQIFTDGEHIGIPLAVLLRFSRGRPRHVTLGHLLTTRNKERAFRWLRPQAGLDAVLTHASRQRSFACRRLGLPSAMVGLLPYQVDTAFWSPPAAADGDAAVISSAGLEYRDYPTLIEAARGEPLQAVIAAGSRWSKHRNSSRGIDLPGNVAVTSLNYLGLRELYARSRFVVMPLRETDNQAGITTILEAMAMGRAVIVSATRGQRDVVRGRLVEADGVTGRVIGGPAGFGIARPLAEEETGLYVPPGDPAALRTAIRYLLDRPDEAERLGAAGRRLVATEMNLDLYVRRIAGWMRGTAAEACATAGAESPAPVSVQRDPEGART